MEVTYIRAYSEDLHDKRHENRLYIYYGSHKEHFLKIIVLLFKLFKVYHVTLM